MINFQGRQNIKTANIIELKAHNVYTHISPSKLKKRCQERYHISELSLKDMPQFYKNASLKIKEMRTALRDSKTFFSTLIYGMQDKKVGNCFEESALAQLIGKINGQKNIYVGDIFVKKGNIDDIKSIDHTVAFITNKKINHDKEYSFKNKEAIIIDPWLGITDFADKYFTQIKNHYKKFFNELPDQDFLEYLVGTESKNLKEFREGRKNSCQDLDFSIKLAIDIPLDKNKQKLYKSFFPELVINKYKKIELPKLTRPKSIEKK